MPEGPLSVRGRLRRRIVAGLLLVLFLVGGAATVLFVPRWGAVQCLRRLGGEKPPVGALPKGMKLVEGEAALGFARALIARPTGDDDDPRPVLLFVPGIVDEHGIENPRVVQAADAFRQSGHIVFVPEVRMFVDPGGQGDDLRALVTLLEQLAGGAVDGSARSAFGVVGISLGGGLALRAVAAFQGKGGRGCRALLAVGAPGNLHTQAPRWFATPLPPRNDADSPSSSISPEELASRNAAAFARNVIYRAALPRAIPNTADRARVKAWLDESWMPDVAPAGIDTAVAKRFVESFLGGPERWTADREKVLASAWPRMRHTSPADFRDRLSSLAGTTVFLLHGIRDPLISIASLAHLDSGLRRHTVTVALRSDLVGHAEVGDVSWAETWRHIVFLDDFFDAVGR